MTAQPKPSDPSMEDILASIRRIIADDQAKVSEAEPPAEDPDDVFDLTPEMRNAPEAPAEPAAEEPAPAEEPAEFNNDDLDLLFREVPPEAEPEPAPEPEPAAELPPPEPEPAFVEPVAPLQHFVPQPPPMPPAPELISNDVGAAVSGAFSQLAHTVLSQNARTLDDLVQDMLRPMLKDWIDDNLPALVERLVRAEIERVARGRR